MSTRWWSMLGIALLAFLAGVWAGCGDPPSHCDLAPEDCYFRCAGHWCRRDKEFCGYNSGALGGESCQPMPACNAGETLCDCLARNGQDCGDGAQRDCNEKPNGEVRCCTGGCCGPC